MRQGQPAGLLPHHRGGVTLRYSQFWCTATISSTMKMAANSTSVNVIRTKYLPSQGRAPGTIPTNRRGYTRTSDGLVRGVMSFDNSVLWNTCRSWMACRSHIRWPGHHARQAMHQTRYRASSSQCRVSQTSRPGLVTSRSLPRTTNTEPTNHCLAHCAIVRCADHDPRSQSRSALL